MPCKARYLRAPTPGTGHLTVLRERSLSYSIRYQSRTLTIYNSHTNPPESVCKPRFKVSISPINMTEPITLDR